MRDSVGHCEGGLKQAPNLGGLDSLCRVQEASDVVVDGLADGLVVPDVLDLLVHQIEVLRLGVQRSHALLLAPEAIQAVVVVQADHCGHV